MWKRRRRSPGATGTAARRAARLAAYTCRYRELDDYERTHSDTRATDALVTHRRCGATFRVVFTDA